MQSIESVRIINPYRTLRIEIPYQLAEYRYSLHSQMHIINRVQCVKSFTSDTGKVTGTEKKTVTNTKLVTFNPFLYAYNYYFRSKKITVFLHMRF